VSNNEVVDEEENVRTYLVLEVMELRIQVHTISSPLGDITAEGMGKATGASDITTNGAVGGPGLM